jgi:molybdate/tungstate transport system permease protein
MHSATSVKALRLLLLAGLGLLLLAPALVLLFYGIQDWHLIPAGTAGPLGGTSLASSALALGITVAGGLPLAWVLANLPRHLRFVAEGLLAVPLLLPPLVVGLTLAYLLGPDSVTHLAWTNTFAGLVAAEVYEAAPYFVFVAWAGFAAVPMLFREVGLSLGWRPSRVFSRVVLPLASPNLAVGAAMAWSRAIGAFGAPIVVSYHPEGLPVGLWVVLEEFGLPEALPLALLLVLVALPLPIGALVWSRYAAR